MSRLAVRTCLDALRAERRRPEWRHADLAEEEVAWLERLAAREADPPQTSASIVRAVVERTLARSAPADRWVITLLDGGVGKGSEPIATAPLKTIIGKQSLPLDLEVERETDCGRVAVKLAGQYAAVITVTDPEPY